MAVNKDFSKLLSFLKALICSGCKAAYLYTIIDPKKFALQHTERKKLYSLQSFVFFVGYFNNSAVLEAVWEAECFIRADKIIGTRL